MKVVKNDQVAVVSGDFRGKKGKVLKVYPATGRIIVEGVNFIKRHTRPTQKNPQGGIVNKEAPLHASNVMVICPKCNKQTRIGKKVLENGKRIRVCKSCNEMLTSS
ncbi:50S ribosomal protein L24 [bacterium]|nr:50S ribosomal protein L24 [bacterium]